MELYEAMRLGLLVAAGLLSVLLFRNKRPSTHFSLEELTTTNTGIANNPGPIEVSYLSRLANEVLEPLREEFGPLRFTSGFRTKAVNEAVGGSSTSDHMTGTAADLYSINGASTLDLATWLYSNPNKPVRQVVVYPETTGHLHVALDTGEPPFTREFLQRHSRKQASGSYYSYWQPGVRLV